MSHNIWRSTPQGGELVSIPGESTRVISAAWTHTIGARSEIIDPDNTYTGAYPDIVLGWSGGLTIGTIDAGERIIDIAATVATATSSATALEVWCTGTGGKVYSIDTRTPTTGDPNTYEAPFSELRYAPMDGHREFAGEQITVRLALDAADTIGAGTAYLFLERIA